jgi:hypothetical protein
MRAFAVLFGSAALLAGVLRASHTSWLVMCLAAFVLALASYARRPLVMLAAAHAGLTATWAGTIASRMFKGTWVMAADPASVAMLLGLCAGMVVLIGGGLKAQQQQPAPVPVRNR